MADIHIYISISIHVYIYMYICIYISAQGSSSRLKAQAIVAQCHIYPEQFWLKAQDYMQHLLALILCYACVQQSWLGFERGVWGTRIVGLGGDSHRVACQFFPLDPVMSAANFTALGDAKRVMQVGGQYCQPSAPGQCIAQPTQANFTNKSNHSLQQRAEGQRQGLRAQPNPKNKLRVPAPEALQPCRRCRPGAGLMPWRNLCQGRKGRNSANTLRRVTAIEGGSACSYMSQTRGTSRGVSAHIH